MDLIEFRKRYEVELKKGNVCREVHLNTEDAKKLLAQHTEWLRSKDTTELCGMCVIPNDSLPAGEVVFISWQPMQETRTKETWRCRCNRDISTENTRCPHCKRIAPHSAIYPQLSWR